MNMSRILNLTTMLGAASILTLVVALYATLGMSEKISSGSEKNQSADLAENSVSILSGRGGGSGVILSSDKTGSLILTNAHVCELLSDGNGRIVTHSSKTYYPVGFEKSNLHDICLVSVKENLGVQTKIATVGPDKLDLTKAIGHPKLLPTTISEGHYAGQTRIRVMTGMTECTEEDLENPETAFICMFTGGMPVIQTYTADIHTSLISGGSSGSPVYNSNKEVVGLVFAGSGEMSEAYVVPVEFIIQTLNPSNRTPGRIKDVRTYGEMVRANGKPRVTRSESLLLLKAGCKSLESRIKLGKICQFADRNTLFVNEISN